MLVSNQGDVVHITCRMLNIHIDPSTHSSRPSPGQTVLAVGSVVQFVVDHCAHCERPRVTTQERHFAAVQDPHGPLHVVQCPLQVGGLLGHTVQLEVQQGNACGENIRWGISHRLVDHHCFIGAGDRPVQPV